VRFEPGTVIRIAPRIENLLERRILPIL
jgi:hypothetical protein